MRQAVVAISTATQSDLPGSLQARLALAHLAVKVTLQALTFSSSIAFVGQPVTSSDVQKLTDIISRLLQNILARWQAAKTRMSASEVAIELRIEELAALADCCKGLCSIGSLELLHTSHIPGAELLQYLLDGHHTSKHHLQVCQALVSW